MRVSVLIAGCVVYAVSLSGYAITVENSIPSGAITNSQRLADENRQLRQALKEAQVQLQQNAQTFEVLVKSLKNSSDEIVRLREDLAFYQSIIAPPDQRSGPRIYSLDIRPTNTATVYKYKLTLVQSMRHSEIIEGSVNVQIAGLQNGREVVVPVNSTREQPTTVKFRYFKEIEGTVSLPADLQPRVAVVALTQVDGKNTIERRFDWAVRK